MSNNSSFTWNGLHVTIDNGILRCRQGSRLIVCPVEVMQAAIDSGYQAPERLGADERYEREETERELRRERSPARSRASPQRRPRRPY